MVCFGDEKACTLGSIGTLQVQAHSLDKQKLLYVTVCTV